MKCPVFAFALVIYSSSSSCGNVDRWGETVIQKLFDLQVDQGLEYAQFDQSKPDYDLPSLAKSRPFAALSIRHTGTFSRVV